MDGLTFATAVLSTAANNAGGQSTHLQTIVQELTARAKVRGTSLHDELAQHFDATMERITRWYRLWTRLISLGLVTLVVIWFSANSITLLQQLTAHPETRLELARIQAQLPKPTPQASSEKGSSDNPKLATGNDAVTNLNKVFDAVKSGPFVEPDEESDNAKFWKMVVGYLITILAVNLGAPFWFDVLARINDKRPASSISTAPVAADPAPK